MINSIILFLVISKGLIGWSALEDVQLKWKYVEQFGQQVEIPVFGDKIRKLQGKEFVVSGHYIPAELEGNVIILSKVLIYNDHS